VRVLIEVTKVGIQQTFHTSTHFAHFQAVSGNI